MTSRIEYLDAVRAFALLLGIVFHASLSFMPIFIGWAVMDISTSPFISIVVLVSHSFRMELFFLIAGFFSAMALNKYGVSVFVKSRLFRIGLPFVVGWVILRPLIVSGWVMGGQSLRGDVEIWPALQQGVNDLFAADTTWFTGTHLWFLYYLLVITALVMSYSALTKPMAALNKALQKLMIVLVQRRWGAIVLASVITCPLWFMSHWGVDTPDKSLLPHIPVTALYTGFFAMGWLCWSQQQLLDAIATLSPAKLVTAVGSIISCTVLSQYETQTGMAYYTQVKWAYLFCYAMMMLSLVAISIGICKRLFNKRRASVRYIADASYWLYLVHLPIVIILQVMVAEWPLHWTVKWFGVSMTTIVVGLMSYQAFVRHSFLGLVLNGSRSRHHKQSR